MQRIYSTKFLGIIIDSKLSWIDHIEQIKKKITKSLGVLCKSRKILNINTLLTLHYSLGFWGSVNKMLFFSSVFKLRKRAVKL